jgi:RNA polymerase sigma-70 factor (ECF subfamily)
MPHAGETEGSEGHSPAFTTTHWSVVMAAQDTDPQRALAALGKLCRLYWYPLYAFVRRLGHSHEDAEDLTQGFFARLLRKEVLSRVDPNKGRFRTFLLADLKHFRNDEWDKQRAAKRGGECRLVSWDAMEAEERYKNEPRDSLTPEELFDRKWLVTVIELARLRLRQEYEAKGRLELFRQLEPCLTGDVSPGFYDQAAARLEMKPDRLRVEMRRLRCRLGELLRSEVAETVTSLQEVEEEIRYLFSLLGR